MSGAVVSAWLKPFVTDLKTGEVVGFGRDTYVGLSRVAVSDDGDAVFVADGAMEESLVRASGANLQVMVIASHGGGARMWSPVITRSGRFFAYTTAGADPSIRVIDTVADDEAIVTGGVGWEVPGVDTVGIAENGRVAVFAVRLPEDWEGSNRAAIYVAER